MKKNTSGFVLIIVLVLLLIVTILAVAGMRGTTLEMKMIASARDRAMAFEAAEATLRIAEKTLIASPPPLATINTEYTENCTAGKCFKGVYDSEDPYRSCRIFKADETNFELFWENEENWQSGSAKYATADINVLGSAAENGGADSFKTVKTQYMVEFMCFTLKEPGLNATLDDKENDGGKLIYMPMYRVTALAEGLGQRARVMAQSIIKINVE